MANWGNMVITTRGKELEAKAHAYKQPIEFKKFKFGNGVIGQEQSYETMTDLVSPKMTLGVSRLEAKPGGGTLVGTVLTNAELNNGFKMFEAGLFAHDPDTDSDILYCVLTDDDPDYLPPKSGDAVISVDFSILILVDSKLQITATLDSRSLMTLRDLKNHDSSITAHKELFDKIAQAIGGDEDFAKTLKSTLDAKAPLASPSFTGTVTGPTPSTSANNTQFATTAWVLSRISALATGPIIGDVSNANGWWVKIPCQGFNLLIQGGEAVGDNTRGTIRFPVAAKLLNIVCTDVYYGDVNSMDENRAVTLLLKTITPEKIDWATKNIGIGSFSWRGFFVQ